MYNILVFLSLLPTMLTVAGNTKCSWDRKTVRMLVIIDDFREDLIGDFHSATSNNALNEDDHNSDICIPTIKFNYLKINDSADEITNIQNTYSSFTTNSFCVIILASSSRKISYALEYAKSQHIPVISIVPKVSSPDSGFLWKGLPMLYLNSHDSIYDKTHSIAPVLKALYFKKVIVIYDNSVDNMQTMTFFDRSLALNNILLLDSFLITQYTSLHNLTVKLQSFRSACSAFVVLSSNTAILDMVLDAAYTVGMLEEAFSWVLFTDYNDGYSPLFSLKRILLFVNPRRHEWNPRDLVNDAIFLATRGLDNIAKSEEKQTCSCRCECKPFTNQLYRCLLQAQFTGQTGLIVFDEEGDRKYTSYDISVMNEDERGRYYRGIMGSWDGKKVVLDDHRPLPKLRALVNEYPPNIMSLPKLQDKACPRGAEICRKNITLPSGDRFEQELCCYGFAIDVLRLIREEVSLGFDADLRFSEDGQYGVYNTENDSWNGIVSELLQNKGDVTLDLYVSARRAKVLDFTEPYAPSGIRLLVKENSRKGNNIYWLSYLRPFTTSVWLTLLGSLGVMIVFLWLVEKLAPNRTSSKYDNDEDFQDFEIDEEEFQRYLEYDRARRLGLNLPPGCDGKEGDGLLKKTTSKTNQYGPFGLDNAVCFTLALAFGRPADEAKPLLNGARLASVAFGVAMLMFVSSYSANLAAFLIVDEKFTSVESIYDDKIAHPPPGFKYGTITGSYMADFFFNTDNAYLRSMWYNMKNNNVGSLGEGVSKVKSGELDVFIADQISLAYESLNDPTCRLKVVGEPFAMSGAAIAVKKGSPWFAQFNEALQKLKSKGLTDFIQKFWVKKYKCINEKPPTQLKIQDLSGLFLQLAIAVVACFLSTVLHRTLTMFAVNYKIKRKKPPIDSPKLHRLVKSLETKV